MNKDTLQTNNKTSLGHETNNTINLTPRSNIKGNTRLLKAEGDLLKEYFDTSESFYYFEKTNALLESHVQSSRAYIMIVCDKDRRVNSDRRISNREGQDRRSK